MRERTQGTAETILPFLTHWLGIFQGFVKLSTVLGSGRFDVGEAFDNRNLIDLTVRQRLGCHAYYTIEGLFGYEDNVPGIGSAHWYGVAQYLTYEWRDKLASTGRLEFFDDADGQRTGFAGLYTAATVGLNYRPAMWLTLRPELRYDDSEGAAFEGKHGLFTATADATIHW